jgi:hypothetical protein
VLFERGDGKRDVLETLGGDPPARANAASLPAHPR